MPLALGSVPTTAPPPCQIEGWIENCVHHHTKLTAAGKITESLYCLRCQLCEWLRTEFWEARTSYGKIDKPQAHSVLASYMVLLLGKTWARGPTLIGDRKEPWPHWTTYYQAQPLDEVLGRAGVREWEGGRREGDSFYSLASPFSHLPFWLWWSFPHCNPSCLHPTP